MAYLGTDEYYENVREAKDRRWERAPECGRCGRKLEERYYETPDGDYCWQCAYGLAYDSVREEEPDLLTESEEFDRELEDYLTLWERTNDYWNR